MAETLHTESRRRDSDTDSKDPGLWKLPFEGCSKPEPRVVGDLCVGEPPFRGSYVNGNFIS